MKVTLDSNTRAFEMNGASIIDHLSSTRSYFHNFRPQKTFHPIRDRELILARPRPGTTEEFTDTLHITDIP
jgi:hypothetical protein